MPAGPIETVLAALAQAGVRHIVVGGVAVVLHGHPRLTADVDLVVALDRANALATLAALRALDYRPRAPVAAEGFADPATRRSWVEEKDLKVFTLWSPRFPGTDVDLFVEEPAPFDEMLARGKALRLGELSVVIGSIEDIIAMKRRSPRAIDSEDIAALERIRRLAEEEPS